MASKGGSIIGKATGIAMLGIAATTSVASAAPDTHSSAITRTTAKFLGTDQIGGHFADIADQGTVKAAVLSGKAEDFSSVSGLYKLQYGSSPTSTYGTFARLEGGDAIGAYTGLGSHAAAAAIYSDGKPDKGGIGEIVTSASIKQSLSVNAEAPLKAEAVKVTFSGISAAPASPRVT